MKKVVVAVLLASTALPVRAATLVVHGYFDEERDCPLSLNSCTPYREIDRINYTVTLELGTPFDVEGRPYIGQSSYFANVTSGEMLIEGIGSKSFNSGLISYYPNNRVVISANAPSVLFYVSDYRTALLFDGPENIGFNGSTVSITQDGQTYVPVPEPTIWALLIIGFGTIGGVMRRRQQQLSFA